MDKFITVEDRLLSTDADGKIVEGGDGSAARSTPRGRISLGAIVNPAAER